MTRDTKMYRGPPIANKIGASGLTRELNTEKQHGQKASMGPYPTLFHLFEHDYKTGVRFWYGIADVACSEQDFIKDARNAGLVFQYLTFVQGLLLEIELEDGRSGFANMLAYQSTAGTNGNHLEVAFTANTTIDRPLTPPQS